MPMSAVKRTAARGVFLIGTLPAGSRPCYHVGAVDNSSSQTLLGRTLATCYCTCNLLPPRIYSSAGHLARRLAAPAAPGPVAGPLPFATPARILVHPMTCPYVVTQTAAADHALARSIDDCLVVPAGCDAMRRLGDALAARYPDRVFALFVPRTDDSAAVRSLSHDLARLEEWLAAKAPPVKADEQSSTDAEATFTYPTPPSPGGAFIVAGPLSDDGLLRYIAGLGLPISGVESCSGPERRAALECDAPEADYEAQARQILERVSCPRSSATARREYLAHRLEETGAAAVIYARLPFCDPSAYDTFSVADLASGRGLPYLEVEVGYPFEVTGPLRVRIEAFLESLLLGAELSELDELDDLDDLEVTT